MSVVSVGDARTSGAASRISTIVPARAVSLQHEKQQAAAPVQVETHSAE